MSKYRKPGTGEPKPEDPLTKEDVFVARTVEVTHWAQRNRPVLTLCTVVVAIAVAALIYYRDYRETLNVTAAAQLEELQQRREMGDQEGAQADLELYLERFSGTPFADEARVALAQISADQGNYDAAAEVLEPIAGDVGDPLGAQAAVLLAAVSEDAGRTTLAEDLYERLADRAELDFQVRDALAQGARLREARGDLEGALELYDRILAEIDELDPGRGLIEMRRAEVAARVR